MHPSDSWPNQQPNHHTGPTMGAGSQHQQRLTMDQTMREAAPKCPRCSSTDTRFSFYANRKLNQPRYLCKKCHRHWTLGGTLRDVPVGGRRRRNCNLKSQVSLDQPPLRFLSSLINEYAAGGDEMGGLDLNNGQVTYNSISVSMEGRERSALNCGQVNYNSTSTSTGEGGRSALNNGQVGSALSGGGSGSACTSSAGSILSASSGLERKPQFPLLGGLEASPGGLYPFDGRASAAEGLGYGAGGENIRPMASATTEGNQQLNLALQFTGMSEHYWNNIGGESGAISFAWPWIDPSEFSPSYSSTNKCESWGAIF